MNTRTQTASPPATAWQKIHRWVHALDTALDFDPTEQLETSARQLNKRVRQLEAVVRRLEASANSQNDGGT